MNSSPKARLVTVTQATDANNAYADLDQIGPAIELPLAMDSHGDHGVLESVTVVDKSKQKSGLYLHFFDSEPTIASTDNAALNIADAEVAGKYLGMVVVAAGDYAELSASAVASIKNVQLFLKAVSTSNSLWLVVESHGAPTYTGAVDLMIRVGIRQD